MWAVRGRYSQAVKDDDPIVWDKTRDGKYTLSLLAVSDYTYFPSFLY